MEDFMPEFEDELERERRVERWRLKALLAVRPPKKRRSSGCYVCGAPSTVTVSLGFAAVDDQILARTRSRRLCDTCAVERFRALEAVLDD
jgi:hypothetical protein